MAQVAFEKCPTAIVEYAYKCRNDIDLNDLVPAIRKELEAVAALGLSEDEVTYLHNIPFFKPEFVEALKTLRPNPENVVIETHPFRIKIKAGLWIEEIFWEIFILSIISELHYRRLEASGKIPAGTMQAADNLLTQKIELIQHYQTTYELPLRIIEFGTRRRYSAAWQEHVFERLITEVPDAIVGTSNVDLARKYGTKVIGTMAHEYLQAFQAFGDVRNSQKLALQTWADVYRGELGIALTDVICMDAFLNDFDAYFAKLYDGLRHDSGCPKIWARKAIAHYEKLGIDPKTKTLVFSDGLDIPKSIELCLEFEPYIKTAFGIGTNLTCDIPGIAPVNHVLKMTRCNRKPVAKLSDAPGKSMCEDEGYLSFLKQIFNYPH